MQMSLWLDVNNVKAGGKKGKGYVMERYGGRWFWLKIKIAF